MSDAPQQRKDQMAKSKVFYWNKPWPGHVGLMIDIEGGEQSLGRMPLVASHLNISIAVTPQIPLGLLGLRNYVSWTAGDQEGNALSGFRAYARTYEEDFIQCGPPPKAADILGLDIDAEYAEWNAIRSKQGATWKILGKNCACVVLRVLRSGGCDQHVRSYMKRNPAIITPQAVWEYAKAAAESTGGTIRHAPL
jgi:hypothetical protein